MVNGHTQYVLTIILLIAIDTQYVLTRILLIAIDTQYVLTQLIANCALVCFPAFDIFGSVAMYSQLNRSFPIAHHAALLWPVACPLPPNQSQVASL